jgi:hypothetical protein
MLSSAIPKRLVVSLVLVGLVSLFMTSFGGMTSQYVSAQATGTALKGLNLGSAMTVQAGDVVVVSVDPIDENGDVNIALANVTYTWGGSCGSHASATTAVPSSTFTAASGGACTGTITVTSTQSGGGETHPSAGTLSMTLNVNALAAAEVAPTYTDPSPVPAIVPEGLTAADVGIIIPSAGGSFTEVGGTASITVPAGAIANGTAAAVGIVTVASSALPSPPAAATEGASSGTFTFGSSAVNVQWYDATGAAQTTYSLLKPAEICLPFSQDDLNGAAGGPDGLGIWRHNGTEWVSLNGSANVSAGTVCGTSSSFSSFAIGLDVAAPGTAAGGGGVALPGTGGYSPSVTTLLLALMAGIVLVATGSFTARRVLWARDIS